MSSIKISQIYYAEDHLAHLDEAFIPYDNSTPNRDGEFEIGVLQDNFLEKNHLDADFTGFVSWKFREKTGLPGSFFIDFIQQNSGYDVYFINPFPAEIRFKNVWFQGDACHPKVMQFTQGLLDKLDYNLQLSEFINGIETLAYCNYWVANAAFWERYMGFLQPLYQYIRNDLTLEEQQFMDHRADRVIDAHYFPFIFERMFSTFLATATPSVRYLSINKAMFDKGHPMWS
jgi:hypothetical protein